MNIKKAGFTCLLLVLSCNSVYAYRGKKQPKTNSKKIAKVQQRKTASKTNAPFSITAFLKEKLFNTPSDRLRPLRSERIQMLAYKQDKSPAEKSVLLAEKQKVSNKINV